MLSHLKVLAQSVDINLPDSLPTVQPSDSTVTDGLQIVFGIFAAVAVLIVAISALRIVISRGNSQDIAKARDAIIYASIGLVISMAAFVIVTFVIEGTT